MQRAVAVAVAAVRPAVSADRVAACGCFLVNAVVVVVSLRSTVVALPPNEQVHQRRPRLESRAKSQLHVHGQSAFRRLVFFSLQVQLRRGTSVVQVGRTEVKEPSWLERNKNRLGNWDLDELQ